MVHVTFRRHLCSKRVTVTNKFSVHGVHGSDFTNRSIEKGREKCHLGISKGILSRTNPTKKDGVFDFR